MLARGLVAVSLAVTGASALTKNCRPESSTTLAIWPLVPGAKTVEQTISVARTSHAAFAVRFTMVKRTANAAWLVLATLMGCSTVFAPGTSGHIAKARDRPGRPFLVNTGRPG